jgi:hypothetical protein
LDPIPKEKKLGKAKIEIYSYRKFSGWYSVALGHSGSNPGGMKYNM